MDRHNSLIKALQILFDGNKALATKASECLKATISEGLYSLITESQIPELGLPDLQIELLLHSLALIDANNYKKLTGVGEREGRVMSSIVHKRTFGFSHGIGRSGDLLEIQPKALGSAIIQRITHKLVKQTLGIFGLNKNFIKEAIVIPCATGMSIMLALRALAKRNPERKKVLWIRIDQKSAIKAVALAGLELVVVENRLEGDEVCTDMKRLEDKILDENPDKILCVISTTSCFAPRAPDNIVEVGKICLKFNIGHIVNNAYGLQSSKAIHLINETIRTNGTISAIIQSTDKNFMVPVGGSIITGPDAELVREIGKIYPGRASMGPILDIFITILSSGRKGLSNLLSNRKKLKHLFEESLKTQLPDGFYLLKTSHNDVSMAIAVPQQFSSIGSHLFYRGISGARFIDVQNKKLYQPEGEKFTIEGFGAHYSEYPISYLTVASAVGQTLEETERFLKNLKKLYASFYIKKEIN